MRANREEPAPPIATWNLHGLTPEIAESLSAISFAHDALWVGGDEGTSVARLVRESEGNYRAQATAELSELLRLPGLDLDKKGRLPEVDIEGMDFLDGALWLVGSHSLKRKKPDKNDAAENIARLAEVSSDGNRYVLGRLALDVEGALVPAKDYTAEHCAGRIECDLHGSALLEALREDEHLRRFLPAAGEQASNANLPGKDNGLDIEGLAVVAPGHVLVGLRGPVLRGWAMLLEAKLESPDPLPDHPVVLALQRFENTDRLYQKIFVDLGGLGIRDLCWDERDLLILAGPTMVLPWPVTVFRWPGARDALNQEDQLIPASELRLELIGEAAPEDRAESLAVVQHDGAKALLVVFDNAKRFQDGVVTADVFRLSVSQLETAPANPLP